MGQTKPVFYFLAGPNGVGKSTLHKALVMARSIAAKTQTEHQRHFFCLRKRPFGGIHDRLRSGCPAQLQSEVVRGILLRAQSRHPSKDRADIQFSIAHEKAVIRVQGRNFQFGRLLSSVTGHWYFGLD
ncbi:MAG: hypothetical protein Q8K22_05350 [Rhodoferax sp.]|nr:hypothetical protein [Rhodoferax sp.]